ncbi:hypothetical protein GOP47_0012168 [Adiantum capillus-veneris]|uniref:Uncharacterized protein n=1 Tax=Adiantum capillus-veneris TaxID=13818 RepID=A0A9D4UQP4_ADICA|nr:hypothetical protein GOP47_0012168 [Adiantum capillus-veneris]
MESFGVRGWVTLVAAADVALPCRSLVFDIRDRVPFLLLSVRAKGVQPGGFLLQALIFGKVFSQGGRTMVAAWFCSVEMCIFFGEVFSDGGMCLRVSHCRLAGSDGDSIGVVVMDSSTILVGWILAWVDGGASDPFSC